MSHGHEEIPEHEEPFEEASNTTEHPNAHGAGGHDYGENSEFGHSGGNMDFGEAELEPA